MTDSNVIATNGHLPRTADVVVIGGGVNGASAAFQLAKRRVKNVVLVERGQLGAGATGKSGALVRAHYTNAPETRLTLESMRIFRNWEEEVGFGSPRFESAGFLQVVNPDDEANLRANVEMQRALGAGTSVVTPEDLRQIEPLMRTDDITVAAFEPESGFADPNATVYGFAGAAARLGAHICTGTEATSIRTGNGQVESVETSNGTIATRNVLLAGGAWANALLDPLGVDLGLVPRRIQVSVFRWPAQINQARRHRVVIDTTQRSWFRPEGAASTLIGVERGGRTAEPDGFDETADGDFVATARDALAARFPDFAHATMRGSWAGMIMQSPDHRPVIDQIPSVQGLYVMAGDSGTSFKTSPAIGVCLAEWITDGAPQLVDMKPFRSTRFAEGQPWSDEHAYQYNIGEVLTISR
ncbi:MAG: NAD(P)/FAD-dependent oxidoreductase [Thermomicrobiales bacterium]